MRRLGPARLALLLLVFALVAYAQQSFSATIQVQSLIRFDKSLGISNGSDISYGRMQPTANQRVSISPAGEISSENGGAVTATDGSHPGRIVIDDGRSQQFSLIADRYVSNGKVRPLSALCTFDRSRNIPCNNISSLKGPEAKTVFVGMVIQVLEGVSNKTSPVQPSFDLAVVYF